jgi:hypothetical protein
VRSKVKRKLIIFFDIKGTVYKEFVLAGHRVKSTYYCDVFWQMCENIQRLSPKYGDMETGSCIKARSMFTRKFFN